LYEQAIASGGTQDDIDFDQKDSSDMEKIGTMEMFQICERLEQGCQGIESGHSMDMIQILQCFQVDLQ